MSYSCYISFKTIEANEIFNFMVNLQKETVNLFEEIANENFLYSPFSQKMVEYNEDFKQEYSKTRMEIFKEAESWAQKCFNYKWFYMSEINLLGIFGIPTCLYKLFDSTIYFQNSCDQNYEFSTWNGVPQFEKITQKWINKTDEEIFKVYESENACLIKKDKFDEKRVDYYRKTYIYDEIWAMFSNFLYDDNSTVNIALFPPYDYKNIPRYVRLCLKAYEKWSKQISEQINEKQKTNE